MKLNPTNFAIIQAEFGDIIIDILDGDGYQKSTGFIQRKTIRMIDGSYLRIREFLTKNQQIDRYYYDWFAVDGKILLKFHSESHDKDARYQTKTEPFHIHIPDELSLSTLTRIPNYNLRELYGILEFIRLHLTLVQLYR
ncbi:toxin-antitoxin system TumE family protein [Caldibacillus thermoamylovorans]|uniref:toxin-antitoxin system TumE family protein n=1 Tax=Caldibacillus thermoamylovorans TaxID=35841 RepID=UPI00069859DC|nr:DUF6516 family protein [Caldibacillus thermoamylovorans]